MNGYLLSYSTDKFLNPPPIKSVLPKHIGTAEIVYSDHGVNLWSWGSRAGDILFSKFENHSLLILNGYITESKELEFGIKQNEVCNRLKALLDQGDSSIKIREFAASIFGSFSLIYLSLKDSSVVTVTDQIASRPVWYKTDGEKIWISSHMIPIARVTGKTNYRLGSLGSFLLYGTAMEPTMSIISGIKSLAEGTLLKFKGTKIVEDRWFEFRHKADEKKPLKQWVKEISDSLSNSAERILSISKEPLIFLSGGVDSRLAGAAFKNVDGNPICCTLGDSDNLEIKVARLTAKALGYDQEIVIRDNEWYLRNLQDNVFQSNGSYVWNHSHFSQAIQKIFIQRNFDCVVLGDMCEAFSKLFCDLSKNRKSVWSESEFLQEFNSLLLPNYKPDHPGYTLGLLHNDVQIDTEKELNYDIKHRYAKLHNVSSDPLIVGDHFFRWSSAQSLPTFQMMNDVRSVSQDRNLMYDQEVQMYLTTLPSAMRNSKNLGARMVAHLSPVAALVPNANSMMPLLLPHLIHSFSKSIRPKIGKARRKLFSNTFQTTASWPHLPLLYAGHPNWKNKVEECLFEDESLDENIFDKKAIRNCWSDFCSGRLELFTDIEKLMCLGSLSKLL